MDRYQYLLLMGGCLLLTLPLEFVYGAGVWRRPGRLVAVLALPAAVFAVWDVLAIRAGIWDFNPRFVTGWELPLGLPVEEAAFFLVIPICALLAHEAVRRSLGDRQLAGPVLAYTVPALVTAAAVVALELAWLRSGLLGRRSFWVAYAICLGFQVLVDGWLTKLSAPIVRYDPDEITGLRFPWDIPVEDYVYGFALITLTLALWERRRQQDRDRDRGGAEGKSVPSGGA